jgi:hypothetical protein
MRLRHQSDEACSGGPGRWDGELVAYSASSARGFCALIIELAVLSNSFHPNYPKARWRFPSASSARLKFIPGPSKDSLIALDSLLRAALTMLTVLTVFSALV